MKKMVILLLVALATPGVTVFAQATSTSTSADKGASAAAAAYAGPTGSKEVWRDKVRKSPTSAPKPQTSGKRSYRPVAPPLPWLASSSSSSSSSVTLVTGKDHSAEIAAINAEIAELKSRPNYDPAQLARLEGRLEGLDSRVVVLETTTAQHRGVIEDHESRIAREESRGHGMGTAAKVFVYTGAGAGITMGILCIAGFKGMCRGGRRGLLGSFPVTGGHR